MTIRKIEDISVGDSYQEEKLIDEATIQQFIHMTKDTAGIHTNVQFSGERGFEDLVVHGFLLSINFSRILGMELPGENTVIGSLELHFHNPVYVGDSVRYVVTVKRILKPLGTVLLDLLITKNDGTLCVEGKTTCAFKDTHSEGKGEG